MKQIFTPDWNKSPKIREYSDFNVIFRLLITEFYNASVILFKELKIFHVA